jgi:hypothetical protein
MNLIKALKHTRIIIKHKYHVFKACSSIGLIWRGIKHDLSKFSPVEFSASVKYFQDNASPIDKEKNEKGYSLAWQHHKRANSHHWEYWLDYKDGELIKIKIPIRDLFELVCDYIGAGKAYNKDKWTKETPLKYWNDNKHKFHYHKDTSYLLNIIFTDISENGWECTSLLIRSGYYEVLYSIDQIKSAVVSITN